MRKVEGFEYYIDEKGTVLKETSEGYKVIKQESYRYYLFKNRKHIQQQIKINKTLIDNFLKLNVENRT